MEALYGVGGYYTTMTAWDAAYGGATGADLVANDENVVLDCYNDFGAALVDNFLTYSFTATDATRNVTIKVPTSERHNGTFGSGFELQANQYAAYHVFPAYTDITGFAFDNLNVGGNGVHIGKECIARGVLVKAARGSKLDADRTAGDSASAENSMFVSTQANYWALSLGGYSYANRILRNVNCLNTANPLRGCDLQNRGYVTIENCYASGWVESGATHTSVRNNASDVGASTAPPGTSPLEVNIVAGDFVDAANGDYHLAPGSQLIGEGVDLSAYFTTDIDGETRGVPWDIGYDQRVSAGSGPTLLLALVPA